MFTGVPTVFSALMAREDFDRYDLSSLRTGIMAGSCYPPTLFQKVRDRMGYGLVPALGLTETTGGITCGEPDDSQIEVGIASVEAVFNWKKYLNENFGASYELTPEDEPSHGEEVFTLGL